MIEKIISIADKAGRIIINAQQSGDLNVLAKDDGSLVTLADRVSDEYIRNALQDEFGIPVISEESQTCFSPFKALDEFFLVDPLDGTKDFIEGRDDFTVNIALVKNRSPVLGVICVPLRKEIFFAEEGRGAFIDKENQRNQLPLTAHSEIILARSQFHDLGNMDRFACDNKITQSLTMSSAVRFCRLAEGKVNLYPGLNHSMEWDTAAGHIIFRESKGEVTDIRTGRELLYNKFDFRNSPFVAYSKTISFGQLIFPDI